MEKFHESVEIYCETFVLIYGVLILSVTIKEVYIEALISIWSGKEPLRLPHLLKVDASRGKYLMANSLIVWQAKAIRRQLSFPRPLHLPKVDWVTWRVTGGLVLTGSCYVRQCTLCYALTLELCRGSASHILFIACTVIHNCSSSGSLVFATLRQYLKLIMWLIWLQLETFINTSIHYSLL